jgi:hypothetical protein
LLIALLAVPTAVLGQGPIGEGNRPDALAALKRALEDASAPALTTAQEEKINARITAFRTDHGPTGAPSAIIQARREYDLAILNQDAPGASAQAKILSDEQAAQDLKRRKDEAEFAIDVVKELRTNGDQVGLLQKRIGSSGLVRLVQSLVRGPGRQGAPPPQSPGRARP